MSDALSDRYVLNTVPIVTHKFNNHPGSYSTNDYGVLRYVQCRCSLCRNIFYM